MTQKQGRYMTVLHIMFPNCHGVTDKNQREKNMERVL